MKLIIVVQKSLFVMKVLLSRSGLKNKQTKTGNSPHNQGLKTIVPENT